MDQYGGDGLTRLGIDATQERSLPPGMRLIPSFAGQARAPRASYHSVTVDDCNGLQYSDSGKLMMDK